MNILLLTSHSIAEYDDLRMLSDLGYDVFSIGAYTDPQNPTDDKRPALDLPYHADLAALCDVQRRLHAAHSTDHVIDWAKADLHPDIVEWADAIIVHHFVESWIGGQWARIRHKRVIWRTCGQSNPDLERYMGSLKGLEIVRYSPREHAYAGFAGESTLIRFGKYPSDYGPWVGDIRSVGNVTQHMIQRGDATGYRFWLDATRGLPVMPAGPGSVALGGLGELSDEEMRDYLRHIRAYLYLGTIAAPYTLGLMEAMLTGVPVVSIGPKAFGLPDLFEGADIAGTSADDPAYARQLLRDLLDDRPLADTGESSLQYLSEYQRQRALDLFDVATVGPQWKAYLG